MAAKKKATKKAAPKKTAKKTVRKAAAKKTNTKSKAKATRGKSKGKSKAKILDMIISKSRTKAAVSNCNVSGDFYGALDGYVRSAIEAAEARAIANGRKTLRPQDL